MSKLTIDHAALILGVSRATIYNWIAAGHVKNDPAAIVDYQIKQKQAELDTIKANLEYFSKAIPAGNG